MQAVLVLMHALSGDCDERWHQKRNMNPENWLDMPDKEITWMWVRLPTLQPLIKTYLEGDGGAGGYSLCVLDLIQTNFDQFYEIAAIIHLIRYY